MIKYVCLILLCVGCSTSHVKDESESYLQIRTLIANEYYSKANLEIDIFENNYPSSRYLCEMYNFRIAYAVRHDMDIQKKKYEDLYEKNCSLEKKKE